MTSTFTEFLRERAATMEGGGVKAEAVINEWREAVSRLLGQIRTWIKEADPDGILSIQEGERELNEQGLGRYTVPKLNICGLGTWVGVLPVSRYVVPPSSSKRDASGPDAGRVDMTDEARRHVLYRARENGQDVWYIDGPDGWPGVFDRGAFEAALMSYLR